jgi:hypothetical protein
MDYLSIFISVLSIPVLVIGYFLRVLHKDFKVFMEKTNTQENRINMIEKQVISNKELHQAEIKVIKEVLAEIKDDFKAFMTRQQRTDEIIIKIHAKMFGK